MNSRDVLVCPSMEGARLKRQGIDADLGSADESSALPSSIGSVSVASNDCTPRTPPGHNMDVYDCDSSVASVVWTPPSVPWQRPASSPEATPLARRASFAVADTDDTMAACAESTEDLPSEGQAFAQGSWMLRRQGARAARRPQGDRFISTRSAMNFELNYHQLTNADLASRSFLMEDDFSSGVQYKSVLAGVFADPGRGRRDLPARWHSPTRTCRSMLHCTPHQCGRSASCSPSSTIHSDRAAIQAAAQPHRLLRQLYLFARASMYPSKRKACVD